MEKHDMSRYSKVEVTFERRADGGLRASSEDVPLLQLSHLNPQAVVDSVKPALEGIISSLTGHNVQVQQLLRFSLKDNEQTQTIDYKVSRQTIEFITVCQAA